MYFLVAVYGAILFAYGVALLLYLINFERIPLCVVFVNLFFAIGFLLIATDIGYEVSISILLCWLFLLLGVVFTIYYFYQRYLSGKIKFNICQNVATVLCFLGVFIATFILIDAP